MKKLILIVFSFLSVTTLAQEEIDSVKVFKPTLKWKGFTQIYFASANYSDDVPYGFTMRRIRVSPYGNLTKNIDYSFSLGYDQMSPSIIDAYLNFKIIDQFQVKTGLFATPGAKSGAVADKLFSTTKMNLAERSMVTQNYNTYMGLKAYRDLGVQIHGYFFDKKLYYATMLANPKADDIFAPSVKTPEYTHKFNGIKSWSRLEFLPIENLGIGAFFGINDYNDSISHLDKSYGAHVIYSGDKVKFFSEIISGSKSTNSLYIEDFDYMGYFFEFGYHVHKSIMPVIGYDNYRPVDGGADSYHVKNYSNVSLGCNFFINDYVKLMTNYVFRYEKMDEGFDDIKNDLFIICLQFSYKQD